MSEVFFKTKVIGHVLMKDADTNEVLVDKNNAVHPQNMARAIARGLAHEPSAWIHKVKLGNGGTHIPAGSIIYQEPNTVGISNTLYNTTYEEIVDDTSVLVDVDNSVISYASPTPAITSKVVVTVILDASQPNGQAPGDNQTTDPDAPFVFDEIGLFTTPNDENPVEGSMLTHLIFSPIEKTGSRRIVITYTLTISVF